jgi:hypothetical protein
MLAVKHPTCVVSCGYWLTSSAVFSALRSRDGTASGSSIPARFFVITLLILAGIVVIASMIDLRAQAFNPIGDLRSTLDA